MDIRRGTNDDTVLDRLFAAYRAACPAPEPGPNFMPEIWERIEARRRSSFFMGRMARRFVTAAMALTVGMAIFLLVPRHRASPFYAESYVEALDATTAEIHELFDRPDGVPELAAEEI
jgi:hypothetical protein